jgi:hypothetical protein
MAPSDELDWSLIDKVQQGGVSSLEEGDTCFYLMDRVHGGYDQAEANRLISNLKMSMSVEHENPPRWRYKGQAIKRFSEDLRVLLKSFEMIWDGGIRIIPICPSVPKSSPDYDDRILQVAIKAADGFQHVLVSESFSITRDIGSSHLGGSRSVERIRQTLLCQVDNFQENELIVILDDVITSAAHFKAYQRTILEICPLANIVGVFWAKQVPRDYDYAFVDFDSLV